jgi:phage-related protein
VSIRVRRAAISAALDAHLNANLMEEKRVYCLGHGYAMHAPFFVPMYRMWYTVWVHKKKPRLPKGAAIRGETPENQGKRVPAIFYRTEAGGEPVRDWLKSLPLEDRKRIGEDIKTVEFGWPIGMPVCKSLGSGIYEVRTNLAQNRIARVLFYIDKKSRMVLLHGFIKKTQKTPREDLELAGSNKGKHERGQR